MNLNDEQKKIVGKIAEKAAANWLTSAVATPFKSYIERAILQALSEIGGDFEHAGFMRGMKVAKMVVKREAEAIHARSKT